MSNNDPGRTLELFNAAIDRIINILIVYIVAIIIAGLFKVIYPVNVLFEHRLIALDLSKAVTDILAFLVMIELFRSFVDYLKVKRIRLHSMVDPAIVFIIRELIIMLYTHAPVTGLNLIGFSCLLLSLGAIRTLAVVFSPEEPRKF
jgi:uncharacterized membrane protein (DUF373 family)